MHLHIYRPYQSEPTEEAFGQIRSANKCHRDELFLVSELFSGIVRGGNSHRVNYFLEDKELDADFWEAHYSDRPGLRCTLVKF